MTGKEYRTLIVEPLRNDGDLVLTEDLLHPDHRIQGSEPSVVQIDSIGRHSLFEQCVLHVGGLIVPLDMVVAADNKIVDFPVVADFGSRGNSVLEKEIGPTTENRFRIPDNQAHAPVRNGRHARVGLLPLAVRAITIEKTELLVKC